MTHLTEEGALDYVSGICFKTGPPRRIGVELEWFPRDAADPARLVEPERLLAAYARAARLPLDGGLSMEPGGQWELSSRPADSLPELIAVTDRDMALLRHCAEEEGLELVGVGHETGHPPRRLLQTPRYTAMEQFFDQDGPWGRSMMCNTASIQVNLDAGTEDPGPTGMRHRWRLLHLLGPVLAAAFRSPRVTALASAPSSCSAPSQSPTPSTPAVPSFPPVAPFPGDPVPSRLDVWARLDPSRTLAPDLDADDPRPAYAAFALDARLLCVQAPDGEPWFVPPKGATFRDWLRGAGGPDSPASRAPTFADLDYHLTTLFPPVRARGHLELRTIDALPGDAWHVPLALVVALFQDGPTAAEAAAVLSRPDTELCDAVAACFELAGATLSRSGAPRGLVAEVARYAEEEIRWN